MKIENVKIYYDNRPTVKCWYGKYKKNGKTWTPKYIPVDKQDASDARRWFFDWLIEYQKTLLVSVLPVVPKATIRGLMNWWISYLIEREAAAEVRSSYPKLLENYVFTHSIADLQIEKIKTSEVEDWIIWLKKKNSVKTGEPLAALTIRNVIQSVRTLVKDAIRREKVDKNLQNPFRREMVEVMAPKAKRVFGDTNLFWTEKELKKLLTCQAIPFWRKVRYVMAVATGARDNEQSGWLWKDWRTVDGSSSLRVERQLKAMGYGRQDVEYGDPKRESFRELPLHPIANDVLTWWHDVGWSLFVGHPPTVDDPIFPVPKGKKRRRLSMPAKKAGSAGHWNSQPKILRKDLELAGLPKLFDGLIEFDFKAFRSTFVTLLELAGVPQTRRDHLMGHKGSTVIDRNYLGRHLPEYLAEVSKLPLPAFSQLGLANTGAAVSASEGEE